MNIPLAERMRPKSLEEYLGQQHLIGSKGALTPMLKSGNLPSMILWGPPGTGKTTLARLLAAQKERPFYQLSAINSGVKEIREILQKADQERKHLEWLKHQRIAARIVNSNPSGFVSGPTGSVAYGPNERCKTHGEAMQELKQFMRDS